MRLLLLIVLASVSLVSGHVGAQPLDPSSYVLTKDAADKYIRATQEMMAAGSGSGAGPRMQGNFSANLEKYKAMLDQDPKAQQALKKVGMSSKDYVLFMGAAMQASMVASMEQAGVAGMAPPGTGPQPKQNVEFMKRNMDLFQRAMTPGAPASGGGGTATSTGDDLPMPAQAGAVLPSSIFSKIPPVRTIDGKTECRLTGLKNTIQQEHAKARELEAASYGNPGDAGLARTPAEGRVVERASATDLEMCGLPTEFMASQQQIGQAALALQQEVDKINEQARDALNKCPNISQFEKDPGCERAAKGAADQKRQAAAQKYVKLADGPFSEFVGKLKSCAQKREGIVQEAKTAGVKGANVKQVLRPLVLAWDLPGQAVGMYESVCEEAWRGYRR